MIVKRFFKENSQKMFKKTFVKIIKKSYLFDKISKIDEKFDRDKYEEIVVVEFVVFNIIKKYQQISNVKKIQLIDILNQQTMKTANKRRESIHLIL